MLRILFSLLFFITIGGLLGQEILPRYMTDYEQSIWEEYLENYQIPSPRGITPPAQNPRTPAEFEENQGVIVTWTSYVSNLREIVRYAREVVTVYIVCSNPSSVANYLSSGGVSTDNVEFIQASFNSVWVRDYGPHSVYLEGSNELAFVDWVYNRPRPADDQVPVAVADFLDIPLYQATTSPNKLVFTGGNFMVDGFNKGFSSKLVVQENTSLTEAEIDSIQKKYVGISPYVTMEVLPYDGIHHIDMHIKLIDEETLLVGEYPEGIADGPQIEANLNYVLSNFLTPYNRPYRVVRIPMPADENGRYPDSYPKSDYLTYTNSIILNNRVLVPTYGLATDAEALAIYEEAMPGYEIIGIDMRNVIPASGAIHCITHEIAAYDPIFISHAPIRDTIDFDANGYLISAEITSASGIDFAHLFWSKDTTQGFNEIPMNFVGEDNFEAFIPSQFEEDEIFYYIKAANNNGKTLNKPLVAPAGTYHFYIEGSEDNPVFYTLNVSVEGEGTTEFQVGDYQISEGDTVELIATPETNWEFVKWEINNEEFTENAVAFIMDEDINATAFFNYFGSAGLSLQRDDDHLLLHPNPSYDEVYIEYSKFLKVFSISIINISGVEMKSVDVSTINNHKPIDISDLRTGIYFIRVETDGGAKVLKFVKI